MKIKKLPSYLINQIAAGEVVERPSSVIKELIENSIDAGAKNIEIKIVDGGKSLISIKDDGCGISYDELPLAIERHATSKLENANLFSINTFGFRGEALASICSISRVKITSKQAESDTAYQLTKEGNSFDITPSSHPNGTIIEVSDLFFATPARLKFLKTTNTESDACYNSFLCAAMSAHAISFKYIEENKEKSHFKAVSSLVDRISDILGRDFCENTKYIESKNQEISIYGFIGVPNYNKSTTAHQRFFVNNRYVKDKILSSIIRNVYKDVIPNGRYPVCVLFMDIPSDFVDVNVHPAKTEVRFREFENIKSQLYSCVRSALISDIGQQASSANYRLGASNHQASKNFGNSQIVKYQPRDKKLFLDKSVDAFDVCKSLTETGNLAFKIELDDEKFHNRKFGNAIIQIDDAYIVSQVDDGIIIIDQHAVCERITLEKLLNDRNIESQQLLLPEVVVMSKSSIENIINNMDVLNKFGLHITKMSDDTICVRGIPNVMKECNVKNLVTDIANDLEEIGEISTLERKIRHIFSTIACHNSVRSGKKLSIDEMNDLLEQMESTANIAQCCHGRPSYIKFSSNELKNLFERT